MVEQTLMKLGHFIKVFSLALYAKQELSQAISKMSGSHSEEYFSALSLHLCWSPVCVKRPLQPVCPSEEGTAKRHVRRSMDCRVGGARSGRAVLQGTELLPLCCGLISTFWVPVVLR